MLCLRQQVIEDAREGLGGVSLRAIQQYEQRGKDVNHAQAISVHLLAQILRCHMEDLLEA